VGAENHATLTDGVVDQPVQTIISGNDTLTIGEISDGEVLRRSGTLITGTDSTASSTPTTVLFYPVRTINASGAFTVELDDGLIVIDASAGNVTLSLPAVASVTSGGFFAVKRVDNSANAVTIDSVSGTIDGLSLIEFGHLSALKFVSDGSNYLIIP